MAANAPHVYIPTGFTPPPGVGGRLKLLDLGKAGDGDHWRKAWGSQRWMDCASFSILLLPAMPGAAPDQQDRLLLWLRDELPLVERVLKDDERQNPSTRSGMQRSTHQYRRVSRGRLRVCA